VHAGHIVITRAFTAVRATAEEIQSPRAGDDLITAADVVMHRGFTVDAPRDEVWPWLLQLGKQRAGWYFPRSVERLIPRSRRATRHLDQRWQRLEVGDVIPDYGGKNETFEVAVIEAPHTLVYRSQRGRTAVTWSITLTAFDESASGPRSRVYLRLRLSPVRRKWLAESVGELFDLLTIAGMAAGLRERIASTKETPTS
jgi:hypothetical protein